LLTGSKKRLFKGDEVHRQLANVRNFGRWKNRRKEIWGTEEKTDVRRQLAKPQQTKSVGCGCLLQVSCMNKPTELWARGNVKQGIEVDRTISHEDGGRWGGLAQRRPRDGENISQPDRKT